MTEPLVARRSPVDLGWQPPGADLLRRFDDGQRAPLMFSPFGSVEQMVGSLQ